jgi:hypothetical protein
MPAEYPTGLDQWPFSTLRREAFRLGQAGEQEGEHAAGQGRGRESEAPDAQVGG